MLVEMRDLEVFQEEQGLGFYDAIIGAVAGLLGAGMQVGGAIVGSKKQEKVDEIQAQTQQALIKQQQERAPYERQVTQLQQVEKRAQLEHYVKLAGMVGGTAFGLYLINKAMK